VGDIVHANKCLMPPNFNRYILSFLQNNTHLSAGNVRLSSHLYTTEVLHCLYKRSKLNTDIAFITFKLGPILLTLDTEWDTVFICTSKC
jgi:hypothetical protein